MFSWLHKGAPANGHNGNGRTRPRLDSGERISNAEAKIIVSMETHLDLERFL